VPESSPTIGNHSRWGLRRRLLKDVDNHDRIGIQTIDQPPRLARIDDAQFMATRPDGRHRAGVGHPQLHAPLQAAQQQSSFDAGGRGERWRLDFTAQPDERFVRG
jgi:hypothetical protein